VPQPSDSVAFRITVPYQASTWLAGPIQRAAMSASSPPFRICGSCGFYDYRNLTGTVDDQQIFEACISITASDFSVVAPSGDVTLRAGQSVILGNGFFVESGRLLTIDIDPALAP
jgi:hypothetical protein